MVRSREEHEEAARAKLAEEQRRQALEVAIEAREMEAQERAPWQDEAWEKDTEEADFSLSDDIAWTDDEE